MLDWLATTLLETAFCIVLVHALPGWYRFVNIEWLHTVVHCLQREMQLAMDAMPLVVGMGP